MRFSGGDRNDGDGYERERAAAIGERREPQDAAEEPQDQRHHDEVLRRRQIHRHQEGEPAQPGAGQVGEIDAAENLVGLEEHGAEIERAGEERQHVEQEVAGEPPLLHRIGDEEDGVEGNLLRQQVRGHRERPEGQQRRRRHAAPVAVEPALADAHDRAGEAEAEHGEAHHQRSEMRPAADREDPHDADLQRDHGAGLEPDREIERGRRLEVELEMRRRGPAHGRGDRCEEASNITSICRPWGRSPGAEAPLAQRLPSPEHQRIKP
jgi:hypothetical protein